MYTYCNNDVYAGELNDGKLNGRGVFWYQETIELYDGEWNEGKRHGRGVFLNKKKGKYDGEWLRDELHGNGCYTYSNGDRFVGTWLNGKMHGNGVIEFENGNRNIIFQDGSKVLGLFKDDHLDKLDAFLQPNGISACKFCFNVQLYFDWDAEHESVLPVE